MKKSFENEGNEQKKWKKTKNIEKSQKAKASQNAWHSENRIFQNLD